MKIELIIHAATSPPGKWSPRGDYSIVGFRRSSEIFWWRPSTSIVKNLVDLFITGYGPWYGGARVVGAMVWSQTRLQVRSWPGTWCLTFLLCATGKGCTAAKNCWSFCRKSGGGVVKPLLGTKSPGRRSCCPKVNWAGDPWPSPWVITLNPKLMEGKASGQLRWLQLSTFSACLRLLCHLSTMPLHWGW